MYEEKINAAETLCGKKTAESEGVVSTNRRLFTTILMIGRLFSRPEWSEA